MGERERERDGNRERKRERQRKKKEHNGLYLWEEGSRLNVVVTATNSGDDGGWLWRQRLVVLWRQQLVVSTRVSLFHGFHLRENGGRSGVVEALNMRSQIYGTLKKQNSTFNGLLEAK